MAQIDFVHEAIIDADPATVYKALLDEVQGSTNWWMPHWQAKPRGDTPVGKVGAIVDITVRGPVRIRLTAKTTEVIENQLIRMEFVEGHFVGDGEWTFEPEDGKTKIGFRWRVRPNRLPLKLMSRFIDMGKAHSEIMQAGFEGLNRYLKQEQ